MKEKDIRRIIRKQLKSKHPNWQRLSGKRKKEIAKEITVAVTAGSDLLTRNDNLKMTTCANPILTTLSLG